MAVTGMNETILHRGWKVDIRAQRGILTLSLPLPLQPPGSLEHARSVPLPVASTLRLRTTGDARGIRLGLNRDFRTHDPLFDAAVYVASDAPSQDLAALLANPELRRDVAGSLKTERGEIDLAMDGTLQLRAARPVDGIVGEARQRELVEAIVSIAEGLPPFRVGARSLRASLAEWALVVGILALPLSVFAALGTTLVWTLFAEPSFYAFAIATGLALAFLSWLPMAALCRGLGRGWWSLKVFAAFTFVGGPFWGVALASIVNCAFDGAATKARVVEVVRADSTYSAKSGSHHYVVVRGVRSGGGTEDLRASPSVYAAAKQSKRVVIETRPGVLGAAWLVGLRATSGVE